MDKLFGIGGSVLCAGIATAWWFFDKPSLLKFGWLVVVALGVLFTGLVTVFQRQD